MPIMLLPLSFMTATDAFQAQKRIHALLSAPDMEHYIEQSDSSDPNAIRISNGSFIWETESDEDKKSESEKKEEEDDAASVLTRQLSIVANVTEVPAVSEATEEFKEEEKANEGVPSNANHTKFKGLIDLSFEIQKAEFVVITGSIGSGKSSLLSAIAGTMVKTQGNVALSGSLAYCGVPWVQNASIRDNITFGTPYDEQWYQYVIKVCSLERDLEILPAGDATEVGERGITLSGGQKARINLARAVYRQCDIILLDDVLSAVDAHVGKSILDNCILGALAGKTRVLATHQISIINNADRVIFLDGTGSIVIDKPDTLRSNNSDFDALMKLNDKNDGDVEENKLQNEDITEANKSSNGENDNGKPKASGALMQDEDKNENGVPAEVYLSFIKYGTGAFKYVFLPVFVIFVTLATFSQIFTNTWLSFWTASKFSGRHDNFYIGIFVLLAVISVILLFSFYTMMTLVTRNTSAVLHMKAVYGILHSPMYFFDSSPLGRILNRFAHDTDSFDNEVSDQARFFITAVANIVGVFVLVIIYLPWFALAIVFLMTLFFCASVYYRSSAREIKRLDSTGRSVVISHFSETLSGVSTIVAYGAQNQFLKHNEKAINRMNSAYFLTLVNQHWLAMRLDMIGCAILIFVTVLCATRTFQISPSAVGLIISYLLQIVGMLTFLVRELATVENNMNAVERVYHYGMKLDQEAAYNIPETAPPENWPEHGAIEFKNSFMGCSSQSMATRF
ncbi:hypothetical protein D0Z00_002331 [Geotrichum galactomycetum]|uniref:Uncharacterized protein n=1 Tax=Geotrichum galactomycetum TaxID=27317 RepID=A0ACB6V4H8_9ASCO|nr:hypothetical protein D0Z00_002331 [Geotrichum candidum]